MKIKNLFLLALIFIGGLLNAQLAGKKLKSPFTAVDGHTYKVGDKIRIGFPTKGEVFQHILYYKFESTFTSVTKVLDVATGRKVDDTKIYYAPKALKETEGEIIYFKENSIGTYAILNYDNENHIAIHLNSALPIREMISNNPEYRERLLSNTTADFNDNSTKIKSFSSNFNTKLVSADGDINDQTVTLTFLVSHKIVHQEVCFCGNELAKLYDFDGNEYNAKEVSVGSAGKTRLFGNTSCNKIPTNIPVKVKVVFNKILPSVKEFSYSEIKVEYKPFDTNSDIYTSGNLEVNNIKVNWK